MEKHLMITGSSKVSWKDAVIQTIVEASRTLDYLTGISILNKKTKINDNRIVEYYVDVDLTFMIDKERE